MGSSYRPALIIVDFQEDFCPPGGSLAVPSGREIAPVVNELLGMNFVVKIATKDWHPADHISFASNHDSPNNIPFESVITVSNPDNEQETQRVNLWPIHCVQGTAGATLVPELDTTKLTSQLEKGQDWRVECYSAFGPSFRSPAFGQTSLHDTLTAHSISHVFVVGLAADYCVKHTALDAVKNGYTTLVIDEGTKPVDVSTLGDVKDELARAKVRWVSIHGPEVQIVRDMPEDGYPDPPEEAPKKP
jgi:nicotinamidase-related amidase